MKQLLLASSFLLAFAACVPVHDYEGRYDMTYDVILAPLGGGDLDVRAGLTVVDVNQGPNLELLIDLGPRFCRIAAVEAQVYAGDWPYLDVRPQACWFIGDDGVVYAMELTGSATIGADERLQIVLSGSFLDEAKASRGSATIELTESW